MKKTLRTFGRRAGKIFAACTLSLLTGQSLAQVANYTFSQSNGTFTPITAGTLIVANTTANPGGNDSAAMDDYLFTRALPFSFTFNGTSYTSYNISTNGWISFGSGTETYGDEIGESDFSGVIAGFGYDLMGPNASMGTTTSGSNVITGVGNTQSCSVGAKLRGASGMGIPNNATITAFTANTITMSAAATSSSSDYFTWTAGEIRTDVTGTAPFRTFIVQFRNMSTYGPSDFGGFDEGITFQIQLKEGGGVAAAQTISVVYGNCFISNSLSYEPQAGLRGLDYTDYNVRESSSGWTATTAGTSEYASITYESGSVPASGLTYTWTPPAQCSGTPVGGTATASVASGCSSNPLTLSATGYTVGSGIGYQWQSSPAGAGTFTDISGATTIPYTLSGQSTATDYRLVVTCTNGATVTSANSNVLNIPQGTFYSCYCQQDLGGDVGNAIDSVSIPTTTLDNNTPGTAVNNYTQYPASGSTTASLTQAQPYTLYVKLEASSIASLWIDYDHSGTFDASEWTQITTSGSGVIATPVMIPATSLTGLTGMRIRSRSSGNNNGDVDACTNFGSGETEDYTINIVAAPACTGTPAAGTAAASTGSACANQSFTLSTTGFTPGVSGLGFQWQSSPAGTGTFTDISGATSTTYTVASQTAATDYRLIVVCSGSSQSDTSNIVSVAQNAPGNCPCIPQYIDGCSDGDDIDTYTLTGEQGTSFNDLVTGCSGTVTGYDDRTSLPAVKMLPGQTYNGTISCEYGDLANLFGDAENAKMWIDLNDDGVFDSADSVGEALSVPSDPTAFSITLPATAPAGVHRMRVRLVYDEDIADIDACSEFDYGEVHDYMVEVICTAAVHLGNDTTICAGASLTLDAGNAGASYNWNTGAATQTINVTSAGVYGVVVTAAGCTASDSITVSVNPLPVAGNISVSNASPSFSFSAAAQNADSYSWNFGDNSSGSGQTVSHTYTANGSFTVTLTVSNDCGTATADTTIVVGGSSVGTVAVNVRDLNLYPNPASGQVTIDNLSTLKMQSATVTNALGAVVLRKESMNERKEILDVSRLAAGVYSVRILTDKGVVVRQLQVMNR